MSPDAAKIARLEAKVVALEEELDLIYDMLGCKFVAPPALKLTAGQSRILGRLLRGGVATYEHMVTVCMIAGNREPGRGVVAVHVSKIRKALALYEIEIETRNAIGYLMTAAMIARFKAAFGLTGAGGERIVRYG